MIDQRLNLELAAQVTGWTMVAASALGGEDGTKLLNDFMQGLTED